MPKKLQTQTVTTENICLTILYKKAAHKMLVKFTPLVSISPTFYEQLFHTKVFLGASLYLHLMFVLFWRKEIGAKFAQKMMV